MAHAQNMITIANGDITLYTRDDVKDGVWQCRMSLKGHRGYIRRSTQETDIERAKEVSLQILGELRQRQQQNLPLSRKTFAEVAKSFLRDAETRLKEGRNSAGRYAIIKGTLNRYHIPYFGKRDITLVSKRDLMAYRAWRQAYWVTGEGTDLDTTIKNAPAQQPLKQEWSVLRGVFTHGIDLGYVSPSMMTVLKHDKTKVNKRPAFTAEEYRRLYLFMRKWVRQSPHPRVTRDRHLLRDYVLIMANTGMRKGEAREIKWRDVSPFTNMHGTWMTVQVNRGKTDERLVVCQPGCERYFDRQRKRGYHTGPEDLVFCHEDGLPIKEWIGFGALLKAAGLAKDSKGDNRTIYSLRHTYATLRLQNGTNVYWLKKNMGTSVAQIEAHYGQTNVLVGIEFETAKRKKALKAEAGEGGDQAIITAKPKAGIRVSDLPKIPLKTTEIVPIGAVDMTPVEEDDGEV